MYKDKKISRFALFCCSILIALSTMLAVNPSWINCVYDTTLCASSTAPTIDSTYFDYKDLNFLSKFDFITDNTINYFNSLQSFYYIRQKVVVDNIGVSSSITNTSFVSGMYYGPASPNSSYTFAGTFDNGYRNITYSNIDSVIITVNSTVGNYLDIRSSSVNTTNLFGMYPVVYVFSYNNTYYTVCNSALYNKYLAYREGVTAGAGNYEAGYNAGYSAGQTAGEQSGYQNGYNAGYSEGEGLGYNTGYTDGHNAGYTDGQNSVINHPSDYDLYTQEQYQNNYNTGYTNGQNSVINSPQDYELYTQSQYDANYTLGYNVGLDTGFSNGYTEGEGVGYDQGITDGYNDGFNDGYFDRNNFQYLIYSVVDVPVETFRSLFNFELLGFNLFNFFVAILTACVLIVLIKLVLKGK